MIKFRLFVCLIFCSGALFGQKYSFVEYGTDKGIPQSQITSLKQDKKGYLWIGTLGGLAKFNGNSFKVFTNKNGLFNNKITHLDFIDGHLLIGHEGGISIFDGVNFNSHSLGGNNSTVQVSGFQKFKNQLLISTNGAGLFELKKTGILSLRLPFEDGERIRDIITVGDNFFIGTRSGIYYSSDLLHYTVIKDSKELSISDLMHHEESIYVCAYQDGLKKINLKNFKLEELVLPLDFSPRSISVSKSGEIWVSSNLGIIFGSPGNWTNITTTNGLPINDIRVVFEDDEERMWFGSLGKGLIYFPGQQFVYYNQNSGMPSDLILNVNQFKDKLYLGSYDQGLLVKDQKKFLELNKDHLTIWTSAMQVDQANWYGTETGLLRHSNEGKFQTLTANDGLLSDKITCLVKINSSSMYLGGYGGLQIYRGGKLITLHDNSQRDIGTIRKIAVAKGKIWIASDKGLYQLVNQNLQKINQFNKTTYAIVPFENGIFVGSEDGLFFYDGKKSKEEKLSDLPSARFITFLNISGDQLYIGTNNGLYIENLKDGSINHYGINDGVINLETNVNASFFDRKNNFWFGTASGLVMMRPDRQENMLASPRIELVEVLLNYQRTNILWKKNEQIELSARKNNLTFNFEAISFSQPENLQFQFYLEGIDETWSPPTSNSSAVFTGLNPGSYALHARVVAANGAYSKTLIYSFEISPPFYKTWWFYTLSFLILSFVVYLFFRSRIERIRKANEMEKMEYKSKLLALEQQSLNASMNRHFIFNSLNSIQYFINTKDKESANRYLTNFAQLIRKNLDAATHDDNQIPLSKEIERLELYLSLESMRFSGRFTYRVNNQSVDIDQVLIPSMLLQPFIENSIIHGILPNENKVGQINIGIQLKEDILEIHITDNGVGISNSMMSKEKISGDHRSQGVEITTKRIEVIKKLSNQKFEIIGPFDWLDENRIIKGTYVTLKIPVSYVDDFG